MVATWLPDGFLMVAEGCRTAALPPAGPHLAAAVERAQAIRPGSVAHGEHPLHVHAHVLVRWGSTHGQHSTADSCSTRNAGSRTVCRDAGYDAVRLWCAVACMVPVLPTWLMGPGKAWCMELVCVHTPCLSRRGRGSSSSSSRTQQPHHNPHALICTSSQQNLIS